MVAGMTTMTSLFVIYIFFLSNICKKVVAFSSSPIITSSSSSSSSSSSPSSPIFSNNNNNPPAVISHNNGFHDPERNTINTTINNVNHSSTTKYYYIALYKPYLTLCTFRKDEIISTATSATTTSSSVDKQKHSNKHHHKKRIKPRQTLYDLNLPHHQHGCCKCKCQFHTVGRLDRDSEGLLLITNDGQFTHTIAEPNPVAVAAAVFSTGAAGSNDEDEDHVQKVVIPKRYIAQVRGIPNTTAIEQMKQGGLYIRGAYTRPPMSVKLLSNDHPTIQWIQNHDIMSTMIKSKTTTKTTTNYQPNNNHNNKARKTTTRATTNYSWMEIILTEGRNRQVRKITSHAGYKTIRLIRISIGKFNLVENEDHNLPMLLPGEWCYINKDDVI